LRLKKENIFRVNVSPFRGQLGGCGKMTGIHAEQTGYCKKMRDSAKESGKTCRAAVRRRLYRQRKGK